MFFFQVHFCLKSEYLSSSHYHYKVIPIAIDMRNKIASFLLLITLAIHSSKLYSHQIDCSGSCVVWISDYSHFLVVSWCRREDQGCVVKRQFGVFAEFSKVWLVSSPFTLYKPSSPINVLNYLWLFFRLQFFFFFNINPDANILIQFAVGHLIVASWLHLQKLSVYIGSRNIYHNHLWRGIW